MTQSKRAIGSKFSVNYVGEKERGERNPSFLSLLALEKALRV